MLFQRKGFPEENEFVICTVNKVFPHSVFCTLDEFNKTGVIHISEVSPGRIRNIRDFVKEDKKVICKVLRIDQEKGHIDLSLRRVGEAQKREKNSEIKQEQLAEKILEFVTKKLKLDLKETYKKLIEITSKTYPTLYSCFEEVIESELSLSSLGIDKKLADELTIAIQQRIKPIEVEIKGILHLTNYEPNGIDIIKEVLEKALEEKISITYKSAGQYNVSVSSSNYPEAEEILKKATEEAISEIEKKGGEASFERSK